MTLVEAAATILKKSPKPLHSLQIVSIAAERDLVTFAGANPDHSLQGAIWKHINRQGNPLGFAMVGSGRRYRRYWLKDKLNKQESRSARQS